MEDLLADLKNKKIAVLGFGVEGMSTVRFLHKKGINAWILDKREKDEVDDKNYSEAEQLGAKFVFGKKYLQDIERFDVIVRSPGVKYLTPELQAAKKRGVILTSHIKLFFDLCPARIIGVTGTKGKGTTASLIYEMLKKSGFAVFLGGNIGTPPLDFLDQLSAKSVVVLELSSFQLEDLDKSPHIAVILMIVPEHLDYHNDEREYLDAKRNILRFQTKEDFAIINRDYISSNESDIYTEGQVFFVTRERSTTEQGAFIKEKAIWITMKGAEWKIIDTGNIALVGAHNWENAAAAAMAATLAGATKSDIVEVLRTFKGLEHRLEFVREVGGVRYYNDSFSTTPETAIAAIESFKDPEILILGGSSKNSDFSGLSEVISKAENIKAIIGIGTEWPKIKAEILKQVQNDKMLMVEGAVSMHRIVQAASKIAHPGDVVLLSPACASFDIFRNYKERGEQFKKEVSML